ncbi:helicase-related protein [Lewinella sp. IMCC34191]|uniref:helicase-related protein n=1 Tax=Lewinella sp. IMCC34191 TaxID=2259172 RepID=UPI000E25C7C5|nr:helicase-related protein [Lewinella sp. IMCC34191]
MTSFSRQPMDHWSNNSVAALRPYLERAEVSVDIATGFFTVQGYDLIRPHMSSVRVRLLLGFEENDREKLREAVIANILAHLAGWDAEDRRAAVKELVRRLQTGKMLISRNENISLEGRVSQRDHAKVYIFDDRYVLAGSANLTQGGLKRNVENLTPVEEVKRVRFYVDAFQKKWDSDKTEDLTQELLDALLRWLALDRPFDIYLKTLHVLLREEQPLELRAGYKYPVDYQMAVIERVLRQLDQHRGAMLVASTGLGKTVMATHVAVRLTHQNRINNVIIFSPKQVHPDWRHSIRSAGLSAEVFTRNLLDASRKGKALNDVEEALKFVDDRYLIVIDESQHFRNRVKADASALRRSFKRLEPLVKDRKALILLLTATPYSKGVSDINNQLKILPRTAPPAQFDERGRGVLWQLLDDKQSPYAWRVLEEKDFFEKFIRLPVATVISTSQVARDYAVKVEAGSYIEFGEEKRWLPSVDIHPVTSFLPLEQAIAGLIKSGVFAHATLKYRDRSGLWHYTNTRVRSLVEYAWSSSPATLVQTLRYVVADKPLLEGQGKKEVEYLTSLKARRKLIQPVIDQLESLSTSADPKYVVLKELLAGQLKNKKVLVFCEYLPTALYLENALRRDLPLLTISSTIEETKGTIRQRKFEGDTLELIKRFAPVANADKISGKLKKIEIDILITTNALSTGVNLQDASVVINYDMPWTPDVLIQRAGRVLRMWKEPRTVSFYTFVYDFGPAEPHLHGVSKRIRERLNRLLARTEQAQQFSELPLLSKEDSVRYKDLGDLSRIKVEHLGKASLEELEEFTGTSPFLDHSRILLRHQSEASSLGTDLTSARYYSGKRPQIYLLLRDEEGKPHFLHCDEKANRFLSTTEDDLFDLLKCNPTEEVAALTADEVEMRIQQMFRRWLRLDKKRSELRFERICGCLLIPRSDKDDLTAMIN